MVALLIEGIRRPRRFLDLATLALARRKPLIVLKLARAGASGELALAHTGMLAGSVQAYRAAFSQHGITSVASLDEFVLTNQKIGVATRPQIRGGVMCARERRALEDHARNPGPMQRVDRTSALGRIADRQDMGTRARLSAEVGDRDLGPAPVAVGAPQAPFGYPGLFLLAIIPPLWFRVMNPRLAEAQRQAG